MIAPKLHTDLYWMNRLSVSLQLFKKVKSDVWVCRCPVCGDSKSCKKKARFYFYIKKGSLKVKCHNCGFPEQYNTNSFYSFVKYAFPNVFEEYKKETLLGSFLASTNNEKETPVTTHTNKEPSSLIHINEFKKHLTPLLCLLETNEYRKYLQKRGFTEQELSRLYLSDNFQDTARLINKESAETLIKEPRIVIPFINPDGYVEMIQGRTLNDYGIKYISIKANDDIEKIYGLYELDRSKTVYCVEGPFDSLFVDNCIATCDASLTRVEADVYIWDNQCRNRDVIKHMETAIENGKKIVVWPRSTDKKEDINDLIKSGFTRKDIMKLIESNTYCGNMAKLKLAQWKRVK